VEWNPPVKVTYLHTDNGQIAVVRDDLLKGGTKQRAAIPFLKTLIAHGKKEFVYASPFSGYAQIALAVSCEAVGAKCTIFAEREGDRISHFSSLIQDTATIQLCASLSEAEEAARCYVKNKSKAYKIPLGFNDCVYREKLKQELSRQWEGLCSNLGYIPRRLWVPVGSGTLASIFQTIINDTELHCVDIGVLPQCDDRISKVKQLQKVRYMRTQQPFNEAAVHLPPIPSNVFYDAKLWQFVKANAQPFDVWWNVAK